MSKLKTPRRSSDSEVCKSPTKDITESSPFGTEHNLPSFDELEHNIVKIAMLGEASVGKSALTVRFLTKRFITEYSPTLESIHNHQNVVDGQIAVYRVLDTAGQEVAKDSHILWADACICVYSITSNNSFHVVQEIVRTIATTKGTNFPCMILGNKTDLNHFREVSETEAEKFATNNDCFWAEVSASDEFPMIRDVFMTIYREVLKKRRHVKPLSRRTRKFSIRNRFYNKTIKSHNKEDDS